MKLAIVTRIMSVIASIIVIGLLVFASLKIMDMAGLRNTRMDTIREHSVQYDKIPRLNEETAQKIRKANRDNQRAFAWLGGVLIIIMGSFIIYVKVTSKKNK